MSDWMKKIYFIFIVLIALLAAEEKNISISASGIENLIKINYEKNLSNLIPGLEYESNLTIEFAIDNESLKNLKDNIFIFVVVNSTSDSFYFKRGGERTSSYSTVLRCYVVDGQCSNASHISEKIPFYVKIKSLGQEASGQFTVLASVYPIYDEESYTKLNESLYELIKKGKSLNLTSEERTAIERAAENIRESLKAFELERASKELSSLNAYLENLSVKYNLSQKLGQLEEKLNSSISLKLNDEQRATIERLKSELSKLKENLESGNLSIGERLDEIEYRISKIYLSTKESNEWVIYLAAVIVAIFILLLIVSFLKK
jgi:uncharacterized protein (DUF1778 family)